MSHTRRFWETKTAVIFLPNHKKEVRALKQQLHLRIRTPEDLGVAYLGNSNTAIVPPKHRIDRAEYGRRLAEADGGVFTPSGYLVPMKSKGRRKNLEE
jgi:hypothetical protein